jgi:hypothetical protein
MEEEGEKKEVKKADLSQHQVQVVSSLMPLNQETEAIDVRITFHVPCGHPDRAACTRRGGSPAACQIRHQQLWLRGWVAVEEVLG